MHSILENGECSLNNVFWSENETLPGNYTLMWLPRVLKCISHNATVPSGFMGIKASPSLSDVIPKGGFLLTSRCVSPGH